MPIDAAVMNAAVDGRCCRRRYKEEIVCDIGRNGESKVNDAAVGSIIHKTVLKLLNQISLQKLRKLQVQRDWEFTRDRQLQLMNIPLLNQVLVKPLRLELSSTVQELQLLLNRKAHL